MESEILFVCEYVTVILTLSMFGKGILFRQANNVFLLEYCVWKQLVIKEALFNLYSSQSYCANIELNNKCTMYIQEECSLLSEKNTGKCVSLPNKVWLEILNTKLKIYEYFNVCLVFNFSGNVQSCVKNNRKVKKVCVYKNMNFSSLEVLFTSWLIWKWIVREAAADGTLRQTDFSRPGVRDWLIDKYFYRARAECCMQLYFDRINFYFDWDLKPQLRLNSRVLLMKALRHPMSLHQPWPNFVSVMIQTFSDIFI